MPRQPLLQAVLASPAAATSGLRGLGVAFTLIFMVFPFNPVIQNKKPRRISSPGLIGHRLRIGNAADGPGRHARG